MSELKPIMTQRRLSVRLARDCDDLAAVQRLRWQVFFEEMGANPAGQSADAGPGLDADSYDELCDHLLVIDEDRPESDCVVGTYRLLRESVAREYGGFYSAGEFDLSALVANRQEQTGELLELGRSCVLPAYRTSATISMLWRGIAEYIASHRIRLMFGCASFPGTDPDLYAPALSFLYHNHLAEPEQRLGERRGLGLFIIGELAGARGHDLAPRQELERRRVGGGLGLDEHGGPLRMRRTCCVRG